MKSRIKKMGDNTVVVFLDGKIDYETQEPFRQSLHDLIGNELTDTIPKKVLFDFQGVELVGSSGITSLIHIMKEFGNRAGIRPQIIHVGSEFQKIIKAFDEEVVFDLFEGDAGSAPVYRKPLMEQ
jgi:anti-anti-sigma factor